MKDAPDPNDPHNNPRYILGQMDNKVDNLVEAVRRIDEKIDGIRNALAMTGTNVIEIGETAKKVQKNFDNDMDYLIDLMDYRKKK